MSWLVFPLSLSEVFQWLVNLGHGLGALNGIFVFLSTLGVISWFRAKFWKRKAKEAAKHIDRVETAANQKDEESIWELSPANLPTWFTNKFGGLSLPIIAVGNLKGGVGKTTTTAYLAHCFSGMGLRVLAIDLDYQGSLTELLISSVERVEDTSGISKLMSIGNHQIIFSDNVITRIPSDHGKLSIISASLDFAPLENRLQLRWLLEREQDDIRYRLAYHLSSKEVREQYDVILLDTPPRMTTGTFNALTTCSHVVIPTSLRRVSWQRVPSYYNLLTNRLRTYNPRIQIAGIALTLTAQQPTLTPSEVALLAEFKARLQRERISAPIFARHIPRWNSLGEADFSNEEGVNVYNALAKQIWDEITKFKGKPHEN